LRRWDWIESNLHHVSGVIGAVQALVEMNRKSDAMERLRATQEEHGRDPGFQYILDRMQREESRSTSA
jgi:hypothetical protein